MGEFLFDNVSINRSAVSIKLVCPKEVKSLLPKL